MAVQQPTLDRDCEGADPQRFIFHIILVCMTHAEQPQSAGATKLVIRNIGLILSGTFKFWGPAAIRTTVHGTASAEREL